jgi:hypothetical protein
VSQVRREFDLRHTLFLQLLYPVVVIIRDCRGERHRVTNLTFAHPCAVVASRHPALSTDVGFRLFAAAKMSQTTMNIAAITGPSTMPFMPKTSSPPSVEHGGRK